MYHALSGRTTGEIQFTIPRSSCGARELVTPHSGEVVEIDRKKSDRVDAGDERNENPARKVDVVVGDGRRRAGMLCRAHFLSNNHHLPNGHFCLTRRSDARHADAETDRTLSNVR